MTTSIVFHRGETEELRRVFLRHVVIAGWTGRDARVVEDHIQELKRLGVKPPSATPLFYRVSASRLTVASEIEVCGDNSSGEVEIVLVGLDGALWVGVGSDHTDRGMEGYSVAVSKQLCDKPIAPELWAFEDVADHWDALELRSWVVSGDNRRLYQEGRTEALLEPASLVEQYAEGPLPDGTAMFCGTLPAIGGVRPAERFAFELRDPVRHQSIKHEYVVKALPVVS